LPGYVRRLTRMAARQLSYDGLKALMAIARRRLARFADDLKPYSGKGQRTVMAPRRAAVGTDAPGLATSNSDHGLTGVLVTLSHSANAITRWLMLALSASCDGACRERAQKGRRAEPCGLLFGGRHP
jgi:hypothetical protein